MSEKLVRQNDSNSDNKVSEWIDKHPRTITVTGLIADIISVIGFMKYFIENGFWAISTIISLTSIILFTAFIFYKFWLKWNKKPAYLAVLETTQLDIENTRLLKERVSSLAIEIKEVFLVRPRGWNDINTVFVTTVLNVRNTKTANNSIYKAQLFATDRNSVDKEGELREIPYIKKFTKNNFPNNNDYGEFITDIIEGKKETVVFSQGVVQEYPITFKFDYLATPFDDSGSVAGMPFVLKLTDSYNKHYEIKGVIPTSINFIDS